MPIVSGKNYSWEQIFDASASVKPSHLPSLTEENYTQLRLRAAREDATTKIRNTSTFGRLGNLFLTGSTLGMFGDDYDPDSAKDAGGILFKELQIPGLSWLAKHTVSKHGLSLAGLTEAAGFLGVGALISVATSGVGPAALALLPRAAINAVGKKAVMRTARSLAMDSVLGYGLAFGPVSNFKRNNNQDWTPEDWNEVLTQGTLNTGLFSLINIGGGAAWRRTIGRRGFLAEKALEKEAELALRRGLTRPGEEIRFPGEARPEDRTVNIPRQLEEGVRTQRELLGNSGRRSVDSVMRSPLYTETPREVTAQIFRSPEILEGSKAISGTVQQLAAEKTGIINLLDYTGRVESRTRERFEAVAGGSGRKLTVGGETIIPKEQLVRNLLKESSKLGKDLKITEEVVNNMAQYPQLLKAMEESNIPGFSSIARLIKEQAALKTEAARLTSGNVFEVLRQGKGQDLFQLGKNELVQLARAAKTVPEFSRAAQAEAPTSSFSGLSQTYLNITGRDFLSDFVTGKLGSLTQEQANQLLRNPDFSRIMSFLGQRVLGDARITQNIQAFNSLGDVGARARSMLDALPEADRETFKRNFMYPYLAARRTQFGVRENQVRQLVEQFDKDPLADIREKMADYEMNMPAELKEVYEKEAAILGNKDIGLEAGLTLLENIQKKTRGMPTVSYIKELEIQHRRIFHPDEKGFVQANIPKDIQGKVISRLRSAVNYTDEDIVYDGFELLGSPRSETAQRWTTLVAENDHRQQTEMLKTSFDEIKKLMPKHESDKYTPGNLRKLLDAIQKGKVDSNIVEKTRAAMRVIPAETSEEVITSARVSAESVAAALKSGGENLAKHPVVRGSQKFMTSVESQMGRIPTALTEKNSTMQGEFERFASENFTDAFEAPAVKNGDKVIDFNGRLGIVRVPIKQEKFTNRQMVYLDFSDGSHATMPLKKADFLYRTSAGGTRRPEQGMLTLYNSLEVPLRNLAGEARAGNQTAAAEAYQSIGKLDEPFFGDTTAKNPEVKKSKTIERPKKVQKKKSVTEKIVRGEDEDGQPKFILQTIDDTGKVIRKTTFSTRAEAESEMSSTAL